MTMRKWPPTGVGRSDQLAMAEGFDPDAARVVPEPAMHATNYAMHRRNIPAYLQTDAANRDRRIRLPDDGHAGGSGLCAMSERGNYSGNNQSLKDAVACHDVPFS